MKKSNSDPGGYYGTEEGEGGRGVTINMVTTAGGRIMKRMADLRERTKNAPSPPLS